MHGGESGWRHAPQRTVRPHHVAVAPPSSDFLPDLRQRLEPLLVQAFVPELCPAPNYVQLHCRAPMSGTRCTGCQWSSNNPQLGVRQKSWTGLCRNSKALTIFDLAPGIRIP
jgi:hypothetical protein